MERLYAWHVPVLGTQIKPLRENIFFQTRQVLRNILQRRYHLPKFTRPQLDGRGQEASHWVPRKSFGQVSADYG